MRKLSLSILGGIIVTILSIIIFYNFSWLLAAIVVSSLISGTLAVAVKESRDNFTGFLFGCSLIITIAISLSFPVQTYYIYAPVLGFLSSYLFLISMSEYF